MDGTVMFMSRGRCTVLVLPVLLICCGPGCGPKNNRVAVEGVVTLDGKPVEAAAVTFIPTTGGRPGVAGTDAAGRFVIREAGMHTGLPPGNYDVVIFKAEEAPLVSPVPLPSLPPTNDERPTIEVPPPLTRIARWIVPERYSKPKENGLSTAIAGPTTKLVFSLTTRD